MNKKNEILRTAYMDGELSTSELLEFESSLTTDERQLIIDEIHYESNLAKSISANSKCPDTLWKQILEKINNLEKEKNPIKYKAIFIITSAAAIVFAFVLFNKPSQNIDYIFEMPHSLEEFANNHEFKKGSADMKEFIKKNHLPIHYKQNKITGNHQYKIIGTTKNNDYYTIYYNCCNKPVKVILAPKESLIAKNLLLGKSHKNLQQASRFGSYVAAVVGEHPSKELLMSFNK